MVNVLAMLVFAVTATTLLAGCLLLRAMAGVRAWKIYMAAVVASILDALAASLTIYLQWATPDGMSDEMEVGAALYLNAPLACTFVVFLGGLLLGLLGRMAAQERAAARSGCS